MIKKKSPLSGVFLEVSAVPSISEESESSDNDSRQLRNRKFLTLRNYKTLPNRSHSPSNRTTSAKQKPKERPSPKPYDISGETSGNRFPWMRDAEVQCDLSQAQYQKNRRNCRNTLSPPRVVITRTSGESADSSDSPDVSEYERSHEIYSLAPELTKALRELKEKEMSRNSNIMSDFEVLPSPRMSPTVLDEALKSLENFSARNSPYDDMLEIKSRPSGCITSESSASDSEPSPSLLRRGRRQAVIETSKDCGEMSPHNLTEEDLSSNSNDEGDARKPSKQSRRMQRRRSSGGSEMCQTKEMVPLARQRKVLIRSMTASDIYAPKSASMLSLLEDGNKRNKKSMKKKMKGKIRATSFDESLRDMKPSIFKDNHLIIYKNLHWSDLIARKEQDVKPVDVPETERMRREAVWELFKSECVFLVDHLMVLKHVFLEPLKKIQVDGHVMAAEPEEIFGNLDELCYSIYAFCKEFLQMLLKDAGPKTFGETQTLIRAFKRLSALTKDAEIYHTYCLNYMNAIVYLEKLQNDEEFLTFQRWAEQDRRCNRLKLPDLLVAPMQHCTKLPLLLNQIRKYTTDTQDRLQLEESIEKVELSLQELDGKMKWVKNVERIQEINSQVVWPSVTDLDPKAFIPESLKARLQSQPCDQILSSLDRQVVHESYLTLVENSKVLDIYLFLFDDMLLITKKKKVPTATLR